MKKSKNVGEFLLTLWLYQARGYEFRAEGLSDRMKLILKAQQAALTELQNLRLQTQIL